MREYIQRFKSLFRVVGNIILAKGGRDIGVATGDRIYFDAEQATPNDYLTLVANVANWTVAGVLRFELGAGYAALRNINAIFSIEGTTYPRADITYSLGVAANRWVNGLFGTEVGQHNGTIFVNSLDATGVTLGGNVGAVYHSGDFIQAGIDGTHAFMLPNMTTEQRNALTAVNGMIIYNTSLNEVQAYINGAWRLLTDAAPSG